MFSVQSEEEFKNLPGLRWKLDSDGTPIAFSTKKRMRGEHLYFHGPGKLGIYYIGSLARYHHWQRKVKETEIKELSQPCDGEGILIFQPWIFEDIPRDFFKNSNLARPQNLKFSHQKTHLTA